MSTNASAGPSANEVASTSSADAVEKAAALLPHLRDRTEEAERLRRMPDDTIAAIEDAGLLWMAAPKFSVANRRR